MYFTPTKKNRNNNDNNVIIIIWSQSADHKKDAKWLQDLRGEVNVKKQEKIDITIGSLKKILGRMPNWKSPGPDLVQGFWLKNFSSLYERVRLQLKECLDSGFVPGWLIRRRISLLQKDKNKGNVASNYRPITCLPLMWKLLPGVIADQIYAHLVNSMEKWKVMLCSGNSELGEVEIKQGIFQGDSLSP